MTEYEVEIEVDGETYSLSVAEDEYVLDAAENRSLDLPYSCRTGSCTSCVGRVVEGEVDQSEGVALEPGQKEDGYALLCIAYPKSDCRIVGDVQGELFEIDMDAI